ncbi:hepatitis A virus cellular receptor 1 homolog [Anabas testudineus]|uniref:hepatitis A virus cellular receptor 1 homolog n=1 Tax=Anabas testudineus TaxID=64144 RepID=UPI000E453D76|nr:hepatitis A virus cellular receptor 1 homolog [Anabas testudineus]
MTQCFSSWVFNCGLCLCDDSLSVFIMKIVLLLALLTVAECGSSQVVVGSTGQNITLSCKYDIKTHGELSVCWNRGEISSSGCNNQLIATGGYKKNEETSDSSRYQLLGRLDEGDVSLTILNLTEADEGRYGCRVEIPGWFNDDKHHFDLMIRAAQTTTSAEVNTETSTQPTSSSSQTPGQMTSTDNLSTSSFSNSSSIEPEDSGSSTVTVVLVCIFFGLIALITIGGVVIMARRWKQVNKIPQVISRVQFSSSSSTLELQSRGSAVENIYQIDGAASASEYEYCP